MRIVAFNYPGGVVVYPFEGIEAFKNTEVIDGQVIGEYHGDASEEDLANFDGEWPPATTKPPGKLSKVEFIKFLGVDVLYEITQGKSEDKILTYLFELFTAATLIDLADPDISQMLETLKLHPGVPTFDQAKLDELLQ